MALPLSHYSFEIGDMVFVSTTYVATVNTTIAADFDDSMGNVVGDINTEGCTPLPTIVGQRMH